MCVCVCVCGVRACGVYVRGESGLMSMWCMCVESEGTVKKKKKKKTWTGYFSPQL